MDISDPTSPSIAGSYDTPGYSIGVSVDGDYAYVADYGSGLQVIDISDPTSPTLAGTCDTPGNAYCVAIAGDYAYVADLSSGLQVIDISDPTAPAIVEGATIYGDAAGVAVAGDYAYVTEWSYGRLVIFDISDPTNLVWLGDYNTNGHAWGVVASGDYAYVVAGTDGLQILEVLRRRYDVESSIGRSLTIDPLSNTVEKVRLTTTQADEILWEISVDGGLNWEQVVPGSGWHTMSQQGNDLRWKSSHYCLDDIVNPACTYLQIDWEYVSASVGNDVAGIPTSFALKRSRPNPFSLSTSVGFDLPIGCGVGIRVFDAQGRQVKALVDGVCPAGRHSAAWAGDDDAGQPVGPGVYFVRMEAGDFKATSKVLLTR